MKLALLILLALTTAATAAPTTAPATRPADDSAKLAAIIVAWQNTKPNAEEDAWAVREKMLAGQAGQMFRLPLRITSVDDKTARQPGEWVARGTVRLNLGPSQTIDLFTVVVGPAAAFVGARGGDEVLVDIDVSELYLFDQTAPQVGGRRPNSLRGRTIKVIRPAAANEPMGPHSQKK